MVLACSLKCCSSASKKCPKLDDLNPFYGLFSTRQCGNRVLIQRLLEPGFPAGAAAGAAPLDSAPYVSKTE